MRGIERPGRAFMAALLLLFGLWSSPALADPPAGAVNVKNYGAVGDGKTDDSEAIRKAMAALPDGGGVVYFPPGHYLSRTIRGKDYVTFKGDANFSWHADALGSPVISPAAEDMTRLFDCDGSIGTKLEGLILDGQHKGHQMHGVFCKHPGTEQNIVVDNCKVVNFSGTGLFFEFGWVWDIRRSIIGWNGQDGIYFHGWDGYVIDCIIAVNGRMGIRGVNFTSSTITATRIELNKEGGLYLDRSNALQVGNCFFDRNEGPGLWINGENAGRSMAFTGNVFRINGDQSDTESERSCHALLSHAAGIAMTGNVFLHQAAPRGQPPYPGPRYGIVADALTDSVISANAMHTGAWGELILDRANHTNTIIRDNPGRLVPSPP